MIQQQHDAGNGFTVHVTVSRPQPPTVTRFDRLILRIGNPNFVTRLCDVLSAICCIAIGLYVAAWFLILKGVLQRTLDPTLGQTFFLSLAWVPFTFVQLFLGFVRYAAVAIMMKEARANAAAANAQFFETIGACVSDTLARFMATEAPGEKHTIQ
jgi:phage shock protein PspC (stress-responsive transcriptional regulator)